MSESWLIQLGDEADVGPIAIDIFRTALVNTRLLMQSS